MVQYSAIVFDLDDTLLETFSILIKPLEIEAASRMVQIDHALPDNLADRLLELRENVPAEIEKELLNIFPNISENVLEARRSVFTDIELDKICIEDETSKLLLDLRETYTLFLLTEGDFDFQNSKIKRLEIQDYFKEIVMTEAGQESKKKAIKALIKRYSYIPSSWLIVGNRLDKEIRAGNELGITTVWLQHGEGCGMLPGKHTAIPNYTIKHLSEIRKILM